MDGQLWQLIQEEWLILKMDGTTLAMSGWVDSGRAGWA